jgi:hypothetical protein
MARRFLASEIFYITFCINECIFRALFANIVAYFYTSYLPVLEHYGVQLFWLCLDILVSLLRMLFFALMLLNMLNMHLITDLFSFSKVLS